MGCNHLTYGMHRINGVFSTLFVKKKKKTPADGLHYSDPGTPNVSPTNQLNVRGPLKKKLTQLATVGFK